MVENCKCQYKNAQRGCGQKPGPNRLILGGLTCIRMKREKWYYKLGSIKAVQHVLEYPSKNALRGWIKEFEKNDD